MLCFQMLPWVEKPASPRLRFGAGVRCEELSHWIAYNTFKRGGPPTDAMTEQTTQFPRDVALHFMR